MDQGGGEARDGVQQGVLRVDGDAMGLPDRRLAVHHQGHLGAQPVPDPAQPQLTHPAHAGYLGQYALGPVHQRRIDGVHQAPEHLARRVPQDQHDRGRDRQPDDRVGESPSQRRAARAQQHGQ